jgi:predicted dehydrogenase
MSIPSSKLRATVIGCGNGGKISLYGLDHLPDCYELVAATDLRESACEEIRRLYPQVKTFTDHRAMFAAYPADVVCVSTYAPSHEPITMDALKLNPLKGILVEKPLGDTVKAGRRIVDAVKKARLPMVVPHGMLASSPAADIIPLVHDGAIGKLLLVEFQIRTMDIINAGIHLLNYFVMLTKMEPMEYVLATCETSTRTYRDGMQVETTAVSYGQTRSGIRFVLNSGDDVLINKTGRGHLIRIVGTKGMIEFNKADSHYTLLNAQHPQGDQIAATPRDLVGHQYFLKLLSDMIARKENDYTIADSSLMALELVEASYRSNRHHCKVTFPFDEIEPSTIVEAQDWDPGKPYSGVGGGRNGKV